MKMARIPGLAPQALIPSLWAGGGREGSFPPNVCVGGPVTYYQEACSDWTAGGITWPFLESGLGIDIQ